MIEKGAEACKFDGTRNKEALVMKVYLTNDDGIEAVGLRALVRVVQNVGYDLTVVAPEVNHSGKSQSITIDRPLTVIPYRIDADLDAYRVSGTPTDCVRLVMAGGFGEMPDIVLSGVNWGANLGPDVYVSGTVGAARQAALNQIPAVAWSSDNWNEGAVVRLLTKYLESVVDRALSNPGILYNVNFPQCGGMESAVTRVSGPWYRDRIVLTDATEATLSREIHVEGLDSGSDVACVRSGVTSISPIAVVPAFNRQPSTQSLPDTVKIG